MIGWRGSIVPTRHTRAIAEQMIAYARKVTAEEAVLALLDDIPEEQWPALLVVLLRRERTRLGRRKPKDYTMGETARRAAHNRWVQGIRDELTQQGEREYQRAHKRAARGKTA